MFKIDRRIKKERGGWKAKTKTFSLDFISKVRWFYDTVQWRKESAVYFEIIIAI